MKARPGLWLSRARGEARFLSWRHLLLPAATLLLFATGLLFSQLRESPRFTSVFRFAHVFPELSARLALERNLSALLSLLEARRPNPQTSVPDLKLSVGANTLAEMLRADRLGDKLLDRAPGGDRPFFPAYLEIDEGGQMRCKVALRGYSEWHHQAAKPSLRVRLRGEAREGRRDLELQRPEDTLAIKNWLPERLALRAGLLTGLSRPVRLWLNNEHLGLYLDTHRPSESLAVEQNRLPGTFFKGDALDATDFLWQQAKLWKAYAGDPEADFPRLERLLKLADTARVPEDLAALAEVLDEEQYARWSALAVLTGSSHADDRHNQVFFFESYRGKLEPVVWDFNGYGLLLRPQAHVNLLLNKLQVALYRDPRFLFRRDQLLFEWLQSWGSAVEQGKVADEYLSRVLPVLREDRSLGELGVLIPLEKRGPSTHEGIASELFLHPTHPGTLDQAIVSLKSWIARREEVLRTHLADARFRVDAWKGHPEGCQVTVFGSVAVEVSGPHGVVDGLRERHDSLKLYPGLHFGQQQKDLDRAIDYAVPAPLVYYLRTPSAELTFRNAVTGESVAPSAEPVPELTVDSLHPWFLAQPPLAPLRLGPGRVVLDSDRVAGSLTVAAGTELVLKPGVSLWVRGSVVAAGTADQPIVIRSEGDKPFGCLGFIDSPKVSLEHVRLSGGSVGTHQGVRGKGMLSIYQCPEVRLEHCTIGANQIGDNSINVANSHVEVAHCEFARAAGDALDLELCEGTVADCTFADSGNDGLDLSQSTVNVTRCRFSDSGDKGLSVGEGTRAELRDVQVYRCSVGILVKDGSRALLDAVELRECGIGIDARLAKAHWRVGGTVLARRLTVKDSREDDLRVDPDSYLYLGEVTARPVVQNRGRVLGYPWPR